MSMKSKLPAMLELMAQLVMSFEEEPASSGDGSMTSTPPV